MTEKGLGELSNGDLTFWALTGALTLAVAALLVLALVLGRRNTGPAEAFDLQVYRDQLDEVERDLARGVLSPEDADRIRTEVSRRLLAADAKAQGDQGASAGQPKGLTLGMATVTLAVVAGGAFLTYGRLGAPGYGDLPLADRIAASEIARAERPTQAEVEAQMPSTANPDVPPNYADLVEQLRQTVAERPGDLQGHMLLANSEAALGNYVAAYAAQEKVLGLKGDEATSQDYADLADMMILAAGGYVSPEAERAVNAALARDRTNGVARYYAGLMMSQIGRPDVAFRTWEALLAEGPSDAPWIPPVRAQIEEMAFRAGVTSFELPPLDSAPRRGPTRADIEAAEDMTPEERMDMIRGMTQGLSDRLATEGGPPQDWANLIASLGVLGEEAQAVTIWNEAREIFAGNADALAIVRTGAVRAGLAIE